LATSIRHPSLLVNADIFSSAPFHSCHASTIVETHAGLVAGWFGGTTEGHQDVEIWISPWRANKGWSIPSEVVNGFQSDGRRYPCWNPVLFQYPRGKLVLFYKVGPSPREGWGLMATSADGGKSWTEPSPLPNGVIGPVKNKPVLLPDGVLLCGSSTETGGRWQVHIEMTSDECRTWSATASLNDPHHLAVIQPTILVHSCSRIQTAAKFQ
jgi:predicted neuraminidase